MTHWERLGIRLDLEALALTQAGHEISVVGWDRGLYKSLPKSISGFPVRWISVKSPRGSWGILFALPHLYRAIWKAFKEIECDVIHFSHILLLPIALLVAKKKGCKVVYDALDRYAIDIASYYFPNHLDLVRRIIEIIEDIMVTQIDGVLTISYPQDFLKERYARYCSNVEVLYNVPPSQLPFNELHIKKLREKYQGRLIITYVGDLTHEKGILKLLEITDLLKDEFPNLLMLFIGKFDLPAQETAFFDEIRRMQLERFVEIIPKFMPYNEMLQYLAISHIGLALYQPKERFKLAGKGNSRKIFTYMHAGLPIISTNLGELGKVVAEEHCGLLLDTTSSAAVAAAARSILLDRNLAKEMGENARRAIVERYNWERERSKLLAVYERLK